MRTFLTTVAAMLALSACNAPRSANSSSNPELDALQRAMTGTFTSAAQAAADEAYYDITLHMYPIWKGKGHWLYVEQAVSTTPDQPYRQRVYQLEQVDKRTFKSVVYTLDNEAEYIGNWQVPASFDEMTEADLQLREGCAVILTKQRDGTYRGSTVDDKCKSELRGAAYATSEVTIEEGRIVSWDRGFEASGEQVWGAEKGGYVFLKQ